MPILIGFFVAVAGMLTTVQSGANAALNKSLAQTILAVLVVVVTNPAVYAAVALFVGVGWPGAERIAQTPWWAWLGGLCGGVYVPSALFFAEQLGAAVFTGLTVTAGIVTSIVLDHMGWVGFEQHPAGLWRIVGGAAMIGGLIVVCLT